MRGWDHQTLPVCRASSLMGTNLIAETERKRDLVKVSGLLGTWKTCQSFFIKPTHPTKYSRFEKNTRVLYQQEQWSKHKHQVEQVLIHAIVHVIHVIVAIE